MAPVDLLVVWFLILVLSLVFYVALDGFDLGIGCLLLTVKDPIDRKKMVDTLSPVWDANETWLVLAGGVLFGAFPYAYAAIGPALYWPLIFLLFALLIRGASLEFIHFATDRTYLLWTFAWASVATTVLQAVLLAAVLNGLNLGKGFNLLCVFTILGLLASYGLFGSCYLVMKTSGKTQQKAFRSAGYCASVLGPIVVFSTLWLPNRSWDSINAVCNLSLFALLFVSIIRQSEVQPYIYTLLLLLLNAASLAQAQLPDLLPGRMTLEQAASSYATLTFMLMVIGPLLPIILFYNGYQYFVFRNRK